jgi:pimeloyl-ACP methyl ester carboxylesterase
MRHGLALLGFALTGASAKYPKSSCSDVSFDVPVTSQNAAFSSPPDPNNSAAIIEFMNSGWGASPPVINGTITISDTFTIKGTYCVPKGHAKHTLTTPTIQVLIHGITYNKTMWSGMGFPDYNWHTHANARGYATLALDRLGHGDNPQRPDPLTVVQPQVQIDILHQILTTIRTPTPGRPSPPKSKSKSKTNPLKTTYARIAVGGHSYGSLLASALAAQHPSASAGAPDAIILTGYSTSATASTGAPSTDWASARDHDPARFGADLARGYVVMASEAQRTAAFYGGGYDAAVPAVDFRYADTVTAGEVGASGAVSGAAVGYAGHVLTVTGVQDVFFCEPILELCEETLAKVGEGFPDAASYEFFAPEETGHDLTLHYSAGETLRRVHDWLDAKL